MKNKYELDQQVLYRKKIEVLSDIEKYDYKPFGTLTYQERYRPIYDTIETAGVGKITGIKVYKQHCYVDGGSCSKEDIPSLVPIVMYQIDSDKWVEERDIYSA